MSTKAPSNASSTALLVVGDEEFLRARVTTDFITALTKEHGDLSRRTAEAEGLNGPQIQELLSPELFGGFPVVTITNARHLSESALRAVAEAVHDPDVAVIVDIPKPTEAGAKNVITTLTKAGIVHESVTPLKKAKELQAFAGAELRRAGVRADTDAVRTLAEGEPNLRGIATRADQLAHDHTDATTSGGGRNNGPMVSAEQVAQVTTSATATGFVVADALLDRNPRAIAVAVRNALDAGAAPLFIQAACMSGLRDVANLNTGNTSKMAPWKAQKLRGVARKWNAPMLAKALHEMGVIGETVRSSVKTENDLMAALLRAIA